MNTKTVQDQLANLKSADIAAFKAGQKSNFVINYIRGELIKRAAMADVDLKEPVAVEFSMTAASYAMPALALLSKAGQYKALFKKAIITLKDGNIVLTYTIDGSSLSAEYREKLNEQLGIKLPVEV